MLLTSVNVLTLCTVKSVKAIPKKTYKTDLKPNRLYKTYNHCVHFLTLCGYIFSLSIFAS